MLCLLKLDAELGPGSNATLILKKSMSLRVSGSALKLQQEVVTGQETGGLLGRRSRPGIRALQRAAV